MSPAAPNNDDAWTNDEFLASILRPDEHDDATLVIVNSKMESAVPKGDNYVSVIVRIDVDYTIKSGEVKKNRSIIVKSTPQGETMLKFVREVQVFEREIHMYSVTLPAMYRLVEERTGERFQLGPKHLVTSRPETIVLEDLRPEGYKMVDRRQGLDYQHSVVAFRTLAKFNAASLALHDNDPEAIEYYKEVCYTVENRAFHADFMEPAFKNLADVVETWSGFERFGEKLRRVAVESVDKIIELMNRDHPLKVLNHGDFWTNNMLFLYSDSGKIVDLKMLDFQLIRHTSPAFDIIYLLYTSPSQDILEVYEDDLIKNYLDQLNDTLKQLGCPHLCVTKEELDQEINNNAYFKVFVSMVFCIMTADPEDAPKFDELTEANKLEEASTVMNKAFAGKRFRAAFERRLASFEQEGLI